MAPSLRLLASVVMCSCLGGLACVYWRQSCELHALRLSESQLRKELTSSRGERDQVQFKLNLLREDLGAVQQAREESERRAQELDDQLQEERGKLREAGQELGVTQTQLEAAETGAKVCTDEKATLEEVVDQLRSQLSSGCEAENRERAAERTKLGKEQTVLKEEIKRRRRDLDHVTQQLSEAETEVKTCSQSLAACRSQVEKPREVGTPQG